MFSSFTCTSGSQLEVILQMGKSLETAVGVTTWGPATGI